MALRRQQGGLYREVNVHRVPEASAKRNTILQEILWLRRQTTQRDLALLFLPVTAWPRMLNIIS